MSKDDARYKRSRVSASSVPPFQSESRNGGGMYSLNMPFLMQPFPSTDRNTVAFTTAKLPRLPADRAGLLLLRRNKSRSVECLAFGSSNN